MNTANIKKYAPKARNNFIAAVTKQAARYGISAKGTEPMEQRGDIALIGEKAFPKAIAPARKALERMVEQMGFTQAMEQAAYSWFNRLCAIRYMEIHDFLDHGRRVLSTANGEPGTPQILDDCLDISLPGLDPQQVAELKLDGNKDEELYRDLLLAHCHALHEAMPFLFEAVDDATELLLPDNLTKTDSLIRELVSAIPEDDWQDVEIIGWLYQFYISEKKDQVIGKVVKSEDIPAATQLFTPNWIVQYLVQNSVGRQWLQTYPDSPLRNQMPYFIEPGEQPPEVQAQLAETVPDAIDPESIKVLDPACGSGHILVEAYKILKAIYEERGYRSRDIPQHILKHNLFGLDIDDRAGQLAGFALMMLAREDDRRLFARVAEGEVTLNVLSLQETGPLDLPQLWRDLNLSGDWQQGSSQSLFENEQADLSSATADERYQLLKRTLERFDKAKTFGSLIEVPEDEAELIKNLIEELSHLIVVGDTVQKPAALQLIPFMRQAWILGQRYEAVVTNPPYIGSKGLNHDLKVFAENKYKDFKGDLYSIFVVRSTLFSKRNSDCSFVTPFTWMFISQYRKFREYLLNNFSITSLVKPSYTAFFESAIVPLVAFVVKSSVSNAIGRYTDLGYLGNGKVQSERLLKAIQKVDGFCFYERRRSDFEKIPGSPLAFWVGGEVYRAFSDSIRNHSDIEFGIKTGNNDRFLRFWYEVSLEKSSIKSGESARWQLHNKGGRFRRWSGNVDHVIDWARPSLLSNVSKDFAPSVFKSYSSPAITWSEITSSEFSTRLLPASVLSNNKGPCAVFSSNEDAKIILSATNSHAYNELVRIINPSLTFPIGDFAKLPYAHLTDEEKRFVINKVDSALDISDYSLEQYEVSLNFTVLEIVGLVGESRVRTSFERTVEKYYTKCQELKLIEKVLNDFWGNVKFDIPSEISTQPALEINPHYLYSGEQDDVSEFFRCRIIMDLASFGVGCMMGRYSLDKQGLILASQGETLQDYLSQIPSPRFTPDDDAILPLTDQEWFADDATNRFREFVRVIWGDEHLSENMVFVAESLCLHSIKSKRGESALDTIRRYLSTQFYKDHLRTYKKRPIYWLFSSGKHKAFECLVYLHRYNEGTLARMRTEYVIPLSAKLNAYGEKLEQDKEASTSAAETKRLEKEITTLHKQQIELAEFDEKLRHCADQRISLDLDDGVKVNYGKFGDLLAEVKAVTGEKPQ